MKLNLYKVTFLILVVFFASSCRNEITSPTEGPITSVANPTDEIVVHTVKNPGERVIWKTGMTYNLEWNLTPNLDKVKIVLVKKFIPVLTISEITENDGQFSWKIPDYLAGSHHYRIKMISPYNENSFSNSVEFEISNEQ